MRRDPHSVFQRIRRRVKTRYPMALILTKSLIGRERAYGRCELEPAGGPQRRFILRVSLAAGPDSAKDTIVHEAAHAVAWRCENHGPAWGMAYAECYRASLRRSP